MKMLHRKIFQMVNKCYHGYEITFISGEKLKVIFEWKMFRQLESNREKAEERRFGRYSA